MFAKKESKVKAVSASRHIDTLIGVNSTFTGDLAFEGALRIEGRFEGSILSGKDGTLIVSEGALVKGTVDVPALVLHGDIQGNVHAGCLKIGAKGTLNGDAVYKTMVLDEGAVINGRCSRMGDKQGEEQGKTKAGLARKS